MEDTCFGNLSIEEFGRIINNEDRCKKLGEKIAGIIGASDNKKPKSKEDKYNAPLKYIYAILGGLISLVDNNHDPMKVLRESWYCGVIKETSKFSTSVDNTIMKSYIIGSYDSFCRIIKIIISKQINSEYIVNKADDNKGINEKLINIIIGKDEIKVIKSDTEETFKNDSINEMQIDSSITINYILDIFVKDKVNNQKTENNQETENKKEEDFDKIINYLKGEIKMSNTNESKSIEEKLKEALESSKQIILTGAPGTGKTYSVREYVKNNTDSEDQYKFVQFHSSYDYSDFVEGLRPATIEGKDSPTFVRLDGIFKAFCRKIVDAGDDQKKYYFIVDEINRADLSKVFGELMFGLEKSYRGIENRFDTQYKNLKTYEINEDGIAKVMEKDCFKDGFFIPHNLYFIGTMNDIDRSVESFDFALRRRFQWIDIKANDVMESSLKSMLGKNGKGEENTTYIIGLADRIKEMNNVLTGDTFKHFGLSEAYHIGPAYFKEYDNEESLKSIWNNKIQPILREYTRGRKQEDIEKLLTECKKKLISSEVKPESGDNNGESN